MAPWDEQTVQRASKKEVVEYLQAHADEAFLAARGLVGSAPARAKKAKATDLQKHYLDFLAGEGSGSGASAPAPTPIPSPAPAPSAWAPAPTPAPSAAKQVSARGSSVGVSASGAPTTLTDAVGRIRAENPEIGVKKLVAELKDRFPMLENSGIKVGSKEVRAVVQELDAGAGASANSDSAGQEIAGPREGMRLNEQLAKSLFGVVKIPAKKVRGKIVPAGIEGGTGKYKLISSAWLQQVGPEGPCRRVVLRSKTDDTEVWLFDMPCEAGVAVTVDPFAASQMRSTAWVLSRLPAHVIEAGKKKLAEQQAASEAAAASQAENDRKLEAERRNETSSSTGNKDSNVDQQSKEAASCAALVETLKARVEFLEDKLKQNQRPSGAQLAQFLRSCVEMTAEALADCPSWTKELMDGHLKKLGWDRKANAKAATAEKPPSVEQVKSELVELYESVQMMA
eukprot:COSAG02_NODE_1530_length_12086_cov_80.633103_2_plen_454_part_00